MIELANGTPPREGQYLVLFKTTPMFPAVWRLIFWHAGAWYYHNDKTASVGVEIEGWLGPLVVRPKVEFDL